MNKRAYTLVEILSVIVILAVISAIAYPKILDVIGSSRLTAYNASKNGIIKSAKIKYLSDVNNSKVIEYTVDDLINDGYLKKDIKNPMTNEKYKNTKVIITNEDDKISYKYIEGNTLFDIINTKNDKDGLYEENDILLYKGITAKNYVSFNGEIYRIIKCDKYRNFYLLKDIKKNINKDNLVDYVNSYYNDNYSELIKESIVSYNILDYSDYINSFIQKESYITIDNDIFVKSDNDYKVLSYLKNELVQKDSANIMLVIKINNSLVVQSGSGTQLDPYIVK